MLGQVKGVVGILKSNFSPFVNAVHCAAYRVSLACKVFDDNEIYRLVDACLRSSFKIFARSPLAQAEFRHLLELYHSDSHCLLRIHDIRWLSVYQVLERWLELYSPLLMYVVTRAVSDDGLVHMTEQLLDVKVLVGAKAMELLLAELHGPIKAIQAPDFFLEDLARRLEHVHMFIAQNYTYLKDQPQTFGGREFQKFFHVDGMGSPLTWDDECLKYVHICDGVPTDHFLL